MGEKYKREGRFDKEDLEFLERVEKLKAEKREKGQKLDGSSSEDDWDDSYPEGTLKHHRPLFDLLFSRYSMQIRQSKGFDILDYPGFPAANRPLADFSAEAELLMELANRAIEEYNEKECNAFKFKVLNIEKVNYKFTAYHQYFMTVKVLNLTLGTPIDTFQIHVAKRIYGDEKVILSCWSKEEADVGSTVGLFAKRKKGEDQLKS